MENIIKGKLNYLYEMLEKYVQLNDRTRGRYQRRQATINDEIAILENVLDNAPNNEWDECYQEDLEEANIQK